MGLGREFRLGKKVFVYLDDLILFCQDDMESVVQIRSIYLGLISGLKVNLHKSCMYGVGVDEERLQSLAQVFGCPLGKLPSKHLGMMVGSNPKRPKKHGILF